MITFTAQNVGGENDIDYNDHILLQIMRATIKIQRQNMHVDPLSLCSYNAL